MLTLNANPFSAAALPRFLREKDASAVEGALSFLVSLGLLVLLSRLSFPLPFSPVPITGHTFGVALFSLLWGRKVGPVLMLSYLGLAAAGLPVLAGGRVGLVWGPTLGYLVGMLIGSYVMGALADRGWTQSWGKVYLAGLVGLIPTFLCGLWVLGYFVPRSHLLTAGFFPFLPGELVKLAVVAPLVLSLSRKRQNFRNDR